MPAGFRPYFASDVRGSVDQMIFDGVSGHLGGSRSPYRFGRRRLVAPGRSTLQEPPSNRACFKS